MLLKSASLKNFRLSLILVTLPHWPAFFKTCHSLLNAPISLSPLALIGSYTVQKHQWPSHPESSGIYCVSSVPWPLWSLDTAGVFLLKILLPPLAFEVLWDHGSQISISEWSFCPFPLEFPWASAKAWIKSSSLSTDSQNPPIATPSTHHSICTAIRYFFLSFCPRASLVFPAAC